MAITPSNNILIPVGVCQIRAISSLSFLSGTVKIHKSMLTGTACPGVFGKVKNFGFLPGRIICKF
jgi:uncharacterized membrane protein